MNKLNHTKRPPKMMWGCIALAAVAIVLITGGVGAGALFIILCMLMMGAMMGMMMAGPAATHGAAPPRSSREQTHRRTMARAVGWRSAERSDSALAS